MKILEICGILGIPLSFAWIGTCFLTAYIREKGIKTAWERVKEIFVKIFAILLLLTGIVCLIINFARINPDSLNTYDVITICISAVMIPLLALGYFMFQILKKTVNNIISLRKIVSSIVDYMTDPNEKNDRGSEDKK